MFDLLVAFNLLCLVVVSFARHARLRWPFLALGLLLLAAALPWRFLTPRSYAPIPTHEPAPLIRMQLAEAPLGFPIYSVDGKRTRTLGDVAQALDELGTRTSFEFSVILDSQLKKLHATLSPNEKSVPEKMALLGLKFPVGETKPAFRWYELHERHGFTAHFWLASLALLLLLRYFIHSPRYVAFLLLLGNLGWLALYRMWS